MTLCPTCGTMMSEIKLLTSVEYVCPYDCAAGIKRQEEYDDAADELWSHFEAFVSHYSMTQVITPREFEWIYEMGLEEFLTAE